MIKLSTGTTEGLQKITPEQKIPLASEWTVITQEYPVITEQAAIAGITESAELRAYKTAYSALDDFLHNADTGILADMTSLSFVEPSVYQKKWNGYYTARAKLRLVMAVPPTKQVTDIALAAEPKADKSIDVTVTFRYTQGLFRATHFLLYRATDIHAPEAINTDKADTHIIAALPAAADNHEYTITLTIPQVSGSAQLHYRFAVTAAFLGTGALALHSGGIIDGGASWRDVTVEQPETGSIYNYWNYDTGELRAGKKDNYIRLNPETNELEHEGITIKVPQVEQRIAEVRGQIQEKIDKALIAILVNGYVQWPGMPTPEEAGLNFPGYRWAEVDYNGAFFRAKGNGALPFDGGEQGDAIRNITGRTAAFVHENGSLDGIGVFWTQEAEGYEASTGVNNTSYYSHFDASRVVPTSEENRPRNRTIVIWRLQKI